MGVGRYEIAMVAEPTAPGSLLRLDSWQTGTHRREVRQVAGCRWPSVVNNTVSADWEAETRCLLLVSPYPNVPQ